THRWWSPTPEPARGPSARPPPADGARAARRSRPCAGAGGTADRGPTPSSSALHHVRARSYAVPMETRTLSLPDAEIVHDVHGPLPPADGREVLLVIGQPMTADGFSDLIAELPHRTVVAYDPRGLGRSTRSDGSALNDPSLQAEDLHVLITDLGAPVQMFASSGGAVAALALLAAHPEDVSRVVAHEPPVMGVLPDAELAERANDAVGRAYQERGWGAGLAAFL